LTNHNALAEAELHEPKDISLANAGEIYQADGAGSGAWTRPMDLIASIDNESGTSYEVTGLSAYRELIISVENMYNNNEQYLLVQLYTGSAWRTSGYINAGVNNASDSDNDNIAAEGLTFGKVSTTARDSFHGILRISNFNDASIKTSHYASGVSTPTNYVSLSTTPTSQKPYVFGGMYNTAEAHEGIRFRVKGGNSFSRLYATIWGIKG
jgi:hypothetical protein